MKGAMVDTQRKIDQSTQQVSQISAEQTRIRENMKTVNQQSEYYTRLVKKLGDQETQIEKLQSSSEDLRKTLEKQSGELEEYLGGLNVG